MATFQDLAADNTNIRQQYDEWRDQRSRNGEDPSRVDQPTHERQTP
jgi:hypothetical protein